MKRSEGSVIWGGRGWIKASAFLVLQYIPYHSGWGGLSRDRSGYPVLASVTNAEFFISTPLAAFMVSKGRAVRGWQNRQISGGRQLHCFSHSAFPCLRIGISESASLHKLRKLRQAACALASSPERANARADCNCALTRT